jgi:SNF2 family DNA or RNA helicase
MSKITTQLWAHQRQMADFAHTTLARDGFCWWIAGCAVGKTLSALTVASEGGYRRTLVLTKKTIIDQAWGGAIRNHTDGFVYVPLLKGSSRDKAKLLRQYAGVNDLVVVVNYETAVLLIPELNAMRFDLVVADESHRLKSHNSKQSVALTRRLNIPHKLAMTGTPFHDRPTDAYGQVRWLDGGRAAGSSWASKLLGTWTSFFEKYVEYRTVDNIKIPIRYKNLDQLQQVIAPFSIELDSEKVLTLPPEQDIDRWVEWTPELKRVYREVEKDMIAQYGGDTMVADNVLTASLRLHQLTGGYFTGDRGSVYVATPKIDAVLDLMEEIGGEPVVIFTAFASDVHGLEAALVKEGYKVKKLVGGTYQHLEFQQGDGDVILVNLAAGNAGIELTRARYAIYYSIGHSRTDYDQSRYRIRRPGSDVTKPVVYYHLMLPRSVDVAMHRAMQRKEDIVKVLMEGLHSVQPD